MDPARRRSYYLTDGTPIGNGYASNSDPYAHWAYNFADTVAAAPTKVCTFANSATKYYQVRPSAIHQNCRVAAI